MEKNCCSINVTELENGFRFEITGNNELKEKCKAALENCCAKENIKNVLSSCCGAK